MRGPVWPIAYAGSAGRLRVNIRAGMLAAVVLALLPDGTLAQNTGGAPLSVIDWLDTAAPLAQLPRAPRIRPNNTLKPLNEPAVTTDGTAPQITIRPLSATAPRTVGIVPAAITGMRPDIWAASDATQLAQRIAALPDLDLPAANALLYTLLLAEASAPAGGLAAQNTLTRARVDKLMMLGAVDPALALVEQAGGDTSPALFDVWMDLSLLAGTEDTACGGLSRAPHLTKNTATRIFCAARDGDWDNAALTFGSAKALSMLPRDTLNVLDRFLNPDIFEDAAPLRTPRNVDPLTFRLFETIGEPLPTGPLPRPFAVADLRDLAGWKSQLEAAERLTRAGALPDNRLLGLYTDRKPAASGGIWDRVHAVQRFDTALETGSADAVAKTLPTVWREMQNAGLEVSFSAAFHERLETVPLTGSAAAIKARIGLLSPAYETVAYGLDAADAVLGAHTALIRAVAQGEPAPRARNGAQNGTLNQAPTEALPRAIYDSFSAPMPRAEWIEMARSGRLGEAILATLDALRDGARGDSLSLRDALGTLRALGLEDTARRAALQILLLDKAP